MVSTFGSKVIGGMGHWRQRPSQGAGLVFDLGQDVRGIPASRCRQTAQLVKILLLCRRLDQLVEGIFAARIG